MTGWRLAACLAAVGTVLCACDSKVEPAKGASGPRREVEAASEGSGGGAGTSQPAKPREVPAPLIDPTGSVRAYKGLKHDIGCENNLRNISQGLAVYAAARGEYPPAGQLFRALIESNTLATAEVFAVPKAKVTLEEAKTGLGTGIYRTTNDKLTDATPSDKPIAWDPEPFADGRHVLLFGGTVVVMDEKTFGAEWGKHEERK